MGARSWSAAGPSPTQTARTPACLQSSVYPSPPAMTVQQQQHFHQHQPLSSSPAAWHNRCSDRPTTKYRKWPARSVATVAVPSAAAATTTATDQQATTTIGGGGAAAAVAAAVAAQKFDRSRSVRKDLALDLPPCLGLPDGEERPYGAANRMRIRAYDQESEIYQECIRPPPNRTVQKQQQNDCSSFLPFRCNSEGILASGTAGSSSPRTISPKGLASHSSPSSILTVCCPASSTSSSTASLLGSLSSSSSGSSSGGVCPFSSTRLLLDINGQPIVTRSKSMSTGSPHPPPLAVMVPMMNRSLESTTPMPTTSNRSPPGQELCSSTRSKLASLPVVSCATSSSNSSND